MAEQLDPVGADAETTNCATHGWHDTLPVHDPDEALVHANVPPAPEYPAVVLHTNNAEETMPSPVTAGKVAPVRRGLPLS